MRLLIIEDNPQLIANVSDYLSAHGHTVDIAYDGLSGLRFALENEYDAVVLDLGLPGMDGLEVCRRIRSAGKNLPVMMLTARDTVEEKLAGFDVGTDDYLVKPFDLRELEVRLQALRRRTLGEATGNFLRVADLEFDLDTLRVARAGRVIELAPIPLKLLRVLMMHSPKVVTRQLLEHEVWGDDPPDSDALRAHLHLLRSATDRGFDLPLLHTLRGIGYQLAKPHGGSGA